MNVSMPIEAWDESPHVQWNHIDGPLLHWRGQLHWLTFGERVALFFNRTTIQQIADRRIAPPIVAESDK